MHNDWQNVIEEIKNFNWKEIFPVCNSLERFNDAQWRFLKGTVIELCVEKYSNGNLLYVGEKHKDYDWPKFNCSVELKSNTSHKIFTSKNKLRLNYTLLLNNSMGTNNKNVPDDSELSDIIICLYSDGVFIVDKDTTKKCLVKKGDGFKLVIPKNDINLIHKNNFIEKNENLLTLRGEIQALIRSKL